MEDCDYEPDYIKISEPLVKDTINEYVNGNEYISKCLFCNIDINNTTFKNHLKKFKCFENQGQLAIQFKKQEAERKLMKGRAEKQRVKDKKNKLINN